jgi:diadenylate cyclase
MNGKELLRALCSDEWGISLPILEQVLYLAAQIACEGREGRKIGTIFVVADSEPVHRGACSSGDPPSSAR